MGVVQGREGEVGAEGGSLGVAVGLSGGDACRCHLGPILLRSVRRWNAIWLFRLPQTPSNSIYKTSHEVLHRRLAFLWHDIAGAIEDASLSHAGFQPRFELSVCFRQIRADSWHCSKLFIQRGCKKLPLPCFLSITTPDNKLKEYHGLLSGSTISVLGY